MTEEKYKLRRLGDFIRTAIQEVNERTVSISVEDFLSKEKKYTRRQVESARYVAAMDALRAVETFLEELDKG